MIRADYLTLRDFIDAEAPRVEARQLKLAALAWVLTNKLATVDGLWLEFGVYTGTSINAMAKFAGRTVYGFDSFKGLPEDWRADKPRGRYSLDGALPKVAGNVDLIPGWFEETLPAFLAERDEPAALIHIDCDLYSSTHTVLTLLRERMVPGTILVFDELFNYPGYEQHEIKAFYEFLREGPVRCEWIGIKGPISLVPDAEFEKIAGRNSGTAVRVMEIAR